MEELKKYVEENNLSREVRGCYQCGICAGGCLVARLRHDFNPRRFIERIVRGELAAVIQDHTVWLCTYCLTCQEHCPQRVEVSELLLQIKNASARMGYAPKSEVKKGAMIMEQGWSDVPVQSMLKKRAELDLPDLDSGIDPDERFELTQILDWPEKMTQFQSNGLSDAEAGSDQKKME
ncbi:MAG: 4Fe-4S dicluster domain-containing protein [Desulfobacteraceae bacterium]|nr:4Fe-4S dicluster domain-containing protein [Desulfobacteraceae bacterium]